MPSDSDIALKDEYVPRPSSDEEIQDYNMPLLKGDEKEDLEERRPMTPYIPIRTFADAKKFLKAIEMAPCHESLMPTEEWIYSETEKFRELRYYVEYLTRWSTRLPSHIRRDEDMSSYNWDWKTLFETKKPRLSLLLRWYFGIILTGLTKALDMVYDIPHGQTMDNNLGQWIYALLIFAEQPSDVLLSVIRKFTRQCARLRSYIDHEDKNAPALAAPYSLFICIVNKYYGQHDIGF